MTALIRRIVRVIRGSHTESEAFAKGFCSGVTLEECHQLRALIPANQNGFGRAPAATERNTNVANLRVVRNHLLRTFSKDVNPVAVAALYDGYLENARELTDGKVVTGKNYRSILERKDVDAVTIATPDHWHTRIVLDAISAGKDVYCEKSMTWSVDEGYRIMAAMKNSDASCRSAANPRVRPPRPKHGDSSNPASLERST